jgi:hypothetical protein
MTTNPSCSAFSYTDCDIPAEQTLVAWRRERDGVRQAPRRPRRSRRLRRVARQQWARWTA